MEENIKGIARGTYDVDVDLSQTWRDLDHVQKNEYQLRFDEMKQETSEKSPAVALPQQAVFDGESTSASVTAANVNDADADVDMVDDNGEAPTAPPATAGFTAVNSG